MIGELYSILIQGRRDEKPHLHIVLATAGKQNLVVPVFGAEGVEVNDTIEAFIKYRGCFRHQCSVELDNSKHVKFIAGKTGKRAIYFVGRRTILTTAAVKRHVLEGKIDASGLQQVLDCVMEWHRTKPDDLPPNLVKAVERVIEDVRAGNYQQ